MDTIRVLLVDDEMDFLEALAARLTMRRLEVATATDGQQALEVLGREPVDVVVLDLKMPGLDGLETIARIKAGHPQVEIIMLTGHADLASSMRGMAMGAFDYLLKPVDIDDLVFKLQDACKAKMLKEKNNGTTEKADRDEMTEI